MEKENATDCPSQAVAPRSPPGLSVRAPLSDLMCEDFNPSDNSGSNMCQHLHELCIFLF